MTDERKEELRGLCEKAKLPQSNAHTRNMLVHAARTAVPELLDEVDRLTAELAAEKEFRECAELVKKRNHTEMVALRLKLLNEKRRADTAEQQLAAEKKRAGAAVADMRQLLKGEACDVCAHCCDKPDDVFPCDYEEWCSLKKWEWRGPIAANAAPRVEPITEEQAPSELC